MPTVQGTLLDAGQNPARGSVEVALIGGSPGGGYDPATHETILGRWRANVASGAWSLSLRANAAIVPSGTVYRVWERAVGTNGAAPVTAVYDIRVSAMPATQHARDLMVSAPSGPAPAVGYTLVKGPAGASPQRNAILFAGSGVTLSDDGTQTIVTIPGGGSGGGGGGGFSTSDPVTWTAKHTWTQALQADGNVGIGVSGPSYNGKLDVAANGQAAHIRNTGSNGHALTADYAPGSTPGSTSAALSAHSTGTYSTVAVSGQEQAHGTIGVVHRGWDNGSDFAASAVAVDMQTWQTGNRAARSTGSAARGVFITSTDSDSGAGLGEAILARLIGRDALTLKRMGNGLPFGLGVNLTAGGDPAGVLDVRQSENTKPGIHAQAVSPGAADVLQLKDSAAAKRVWAPARGGLVVGGQSLLTSATDGYLYVPTVTGGPPAGTPTAQAGAAALAVEATGERAHFHVAGAWRSVALGTGGGRYDQTIGDGSATSFVISHGLGTRAVHVAVFRAASPFEEVTTAVARPTTNAVTVTFDVAPTAGQYVVVVSAAPVSSRHETAIGDGTAATFTVTHGLGTKAVHVTAYQSASPYEEVDVAVSRPTTNTVTVTFDTAPASGAYTVVVS